MIWNAVIFGPADTPFEDGTFKLVLTFDESYPNKPPTVKFLSKMFHPNVYANGELCLDILQNRWSPTYDVAAILTSIQSLLHDPNPNSPANAEAASMAFRALAEYPRLLASPRLLHKLLYCLLGGNPVYRGGRNLAHWSQSRLKGGAPSGYAS